MNARELTDGGLVSTYTFWEVSIPVTVASIIIPIAFSGLLIRLTTKGLRYLYQVWLLGWPFFLTAFFLALNVASAVVGGKALFWVLWTANLLYTLEFLHGMPKRLRGATLTVKSFGHVIAARIARRAVSFNSSVPSDQSANFQERRSTDTLSSRRSDSSWETIQSSDSEHSWVTVHSPTISRNSSPSYSMDSNNDLEEMRKDIQMRKDMYREVIQFLFQPGITATRVGGFILGITFLILDLLSHPKSQASLSFYHSFALWMSLVRILRMLLVIVVKKVFYWFIGIFERHDAGWLKALSSGYRRRSRSRTRNRQRPPEANEKQNSTEGGSAGMV